MTRIAVTLGLVFCTAYAGLAQAGEQDVQLAQGAGRDLTISRCAICHSVDYIEMVSPVMNRAAWEKSLRKMIDTFGAPVSEEEARQILDYLSERYSG